MTSGTEPGGGRAAPGDASRTTLSGPDAEVDPGAVGQGPLDLSSPNTTLSGEGGGGEPEAPAPEGREQSGIAGDFEMGRELGRGGMGAVHVALQRSLGREVAVKALLPHLAGTAAAERFAGEAAITGRLEHPSVPPVHVFGRDAEGRPFLAMKLVKGIGWDRLLEPKTEADRAKAAAVDLRGHLQVLARVCEAVAFAHSLGIIHRDLKPENVMVGEFGEVQVMDWGIAFDLERRPAPVGGKGAGAPLAPVGSPAYMAPEMASRVDSRLGPQTDVYLLGGILYEILTGSPPHQGSSVLEVIVAASHGDVEPPARRSPEKKIPDALAAIAMRALERDPEKRYASARHFARALDEYARHEASLELTEAALAGLAEAEGAAARREAPRSAIYGRLAAAIASLEQAIRLWAENERARTGLVRTRLAFAGIAVDAGDLALAEAQLDDARAEGDPRLAALRERVASAHAARARSERRRRQAFAAAALLAIVALVAVVQAVRAVRAMMRRDAANRIIGALYGDETPDFRIKTYERAIEQDDTFEQGYFQLAIALCDRGYALAAKGDQAGCEADMRRAIVALDQAIAKGVGGRGHYQRAQIHEDLCEPEKALADYRRTAEISAEGFFGHAAAAAAALIEGRYAVTIEQATAALAIDSSADATFCRRGQAHLAIGDLDRAIADFTNSIRLYPTGAQYWVFRSQVRAMKGDRVGALRDLLDGWEQGPTDLYVLDGLGREMLAAGAAGRARALAEAAVAAGPEIAGTYVGRARARRAAGDAAGAVEDLRRALAIEPRCAEAARDLAELEGLPPLGGRHEPPRRGGDVMGELENQARGEAPAGAPEAGDPLARAEDAFRRGAFERAAALARSATPTPTPIPIPTASAMPAGDLPPAAAALLARIDLARGATATALARLDAALARAPGEAGAAPLHALRATARRLSGDAGGAAADAERAIALGDRSPAALRERAIAHFGRGEGGLALLDADRALRAGPFDVEALLVRAACRKAEGDAEGMAADLALAGALAPDLEAEIQAIRGR